MSQNSQFVYSFVARGTQSGTILAEYTSFTGNFSSIAAQCLETLPLENNKYTFPHEGHTLNYLVDGEYVYMVLAGGDLSRELVFAFLEKVKEDFSKRYASKASSLGPNALNKEFGPKLKDHMEYAEKHPEELSKFAKIKAQVAEVKGVMKDNIDKVLARGERMDVLVDKTDQLKDQANDFKRQGVKIRSKMWYQNMRMKLIVLAIIVILILVIWLVICKGFTCTSS